MTLELRRPCVTLEDTYLSGFDELESDRERSSWGYLGLAGAGESLGKDFGAFVRTLLAREHTAQPGFVTDTIYWAIREGEMVGRISLRHALNEALLLEGGHTGYIVRPS